MYNNMYYNPTGNPFQNPIMTQFGSYNGPIGNYNQYNSGGEPMYNPITGEYVLYQPQYNNNYYLEQIEQQKQIFVNESKLLQTLTSCALTYIGKTNEEIQQAVDYYSADNRMKRHMELMQPYRPPIEEVPELGIYIAIVDELGNEIEALDVNKSVTHKLRVQDENNIMHAYVDRTNEKQINFVNRYFTAVKKEFPDDMGLAEYLTKANMLLMEEKLIQNEIKKNNVKTYYDNNMYKNFISNSLVNETIKKSAFGSFNSVAEYTAHTGISLDPNKGSINITVPESLRRKFDPSTYNERQTNFINQAVQNAAKKGDSGI